MYVLIRVTLALGLTSVLVEIAEREVRLSPRAGPGFALNQSFAPQWGRYVDCTGRGFYEGTLWDLACLTTNGSHFRLEHWALGSDGTASRLGGGNVVLSALPAPPPPPNRTAGESRWFLTVAGYSSGYLDTGGIVQQFTSAGNYGGVAQLLPGCACYKNASIARIACMCAGGVLQELDPDQPGVVVLRSQTYARNFTGVAFNGDSAALYDAASIARADAASFALRGSPVPLRGPGPPAAVLPLESGECLVVYEAGATLLGDGGEAPLSAPSNETYVGVLGLAGGAAELLTAAWTVISVPLVPCCAASSEPGPSSALSRTGGSLSSAPPSRPPPFPSSSSGSPPFPESSGAGSASSPSSGPAPPPASSDTAPAPSETSPAPSDTAPASSDTAPASSDTSPVSSDTAPAPSDTSPASSDTSPVSSDTAPASSSGAVPFPASASGVSVSGLPGDSSASARSLPHSTEGAPGSPSLAWIVAVGVALLLVASAVGGLAILWRRRQQRRRRPGAAAAAGGQPDVELQAPYVRFDPPDIDLSAKKLCPVREWLGFKVELLNESERQLEYAFETVDTDRLELRPSSTRVTLKPRSFIDFNCEAYLKYTTRAESELVGAGTPIVRLRVRATGDLSDFLDAEEFRYDRQLGQGSFGVVWAGSYRGAPVAIKKSVIDLNTAGGSYREEWDKEVDLLRRLRNPYIVSFVGCSVIPSCYAIITELAPLGSLGAYARSHPDFPAELKRLMLSDACRGLAFLHGNSVIHRDVKPDNVLVFTESVSPGVVRCKLTDFGTSRSLGNEANTMTKAVGTPLYMAPEVLRSGRYGMPADIFSMGVLIFAVATQSEPYAEYPHCRTTFALTELILNGTRPTFPDASTRLARAAEACWRPEPEERPPCDTLLAMLLEA